MIEIQNLSFRYHNTSPFVLNEISVALDHGRMYVLLGLNGSGKTTLIKLLAGLNRPTSGEIRYDGKHLATISIHERSKIIAYVAQHSGRIDDFCVLDYLLLGTVNRTRFYEQPTPETEQKVKEIADRLGITHLLDKKLGEISGGERQIVSVASAIAQNTATILLDEPTSALDICNQYKVLSVLKELTEKDGKTIVLSTHNPNHALYLDAEVFLLHKGTILDHGSAEKIVVPEKLKSIYGERICFSKELPYREISFS